MSPLTVRGSGNKSESSERELVACGVHDHVAAAGKLAEEHRVEVWDGKDLVGGVYGVDSGGVFTGESMFYRKPNGSKLALLHLIEHLRERGATWLDCQVMTPHMEALGARLITRARFLDMLEAAQKRGLTLFANR